MQRAKKSFGQNWLVDETAVKKMIDAAQIISGERVLEIGPGTGIITQALVDAGAKVTAIELDHDLVEPLQEKFGDRVEIVEGDALNLWKTDSGKGGHPPSLKLWWTGSKTRPYDFGVYKIVSSIPYNITSDLLKTFLTAPNPPTSMTLVVQKEVAQRIVAKPPHMSLLSVVCQVYAKCEYIATIKAGAFRPIPKVDSAIIHLSLISYQNAFNPEDIIRIAKIGFSSKRKQLQNNLATVMQATSVKEFLEQAGIARNARAENLTVDDWIKLVGKMRAV